MRNPFLSCRASCHSLGQLRSSENVKVKMLDALAGVVSAVGYDSVSPLCAERCGDLGDDLKDVSYRFAVSLVDRVCTADMLLRDNESVDRCLRIYVEESKNAIVLVYLF